MTGESSSGFGRWRGHHILTILARLLLAIIFIWAAVHKIWDPADFAMNVATYQLLPLSLINLQAIGLPWVEVVVGVTLIVGLWTRESALVTVGMNLMFIVAIVITLYRGEEIMCGCFASGDVGHQIGWDLVIRDIGLVLVGGYLVWAGPRLATLDCAIAHRRQVRNEKG